MDTIHQPADRIADPAAARYFRAIYEAADEEAALRGLKPEPFRFPAA
jgi:hypothetical protein